MATPIRRSSCAALLLAIAATAACGGHAGRPAHPAGDAPGPGDAAFAAEVERFYWPHMDFRPAMAVRLGHHQYDGRTADRSPAAIAAETARLHASLGTFNAIAPATLSVNRRVEREVLLSEIRSELFNLEVLRLPWRSPFYYIRGLGLDAYVARDYAPLPQRAAALLAGCKGASAYLAQADANLEPVLPRPWLELGVGMSHGAASFVRKDARAAMAGLTDPALVAPLGDCLDHLAGDLDGFADRLAARLPQASSDYALGEANFLRMLADTQGVTLDLATLEQMGRADLERNQEAMRQAAAAIAPGRDVREVVDMVSADKPAADGVLAEAAADVALLREFVVAKKLATVPGDQIAEARESPSFMRSNMASLDSPGPFEERSLPAFFYISPPDPSWPPEQQLGYLPSRADLLFIAAHEVWPGHFLQNLHSDKTGSRVLLSFESYMTSEGWAHYAEEMAWDAGLGDGDPRMHVGQLKNALLRDVRFLVAIGLHTHGMTVDEAAALFVSGAYADPATARQQAVRGTLDPMYLSYTLGKLIILDMRKQWMARHPGASLQEFHDAFLAHGEAPLPVIRGLLLGE